MSVRVYAALFGILFLALGVLGYYPRLIPGEEWLSYFTINSIHNIFHIITGIFGVLAAISSIYYSRIYFKVFGVIYLFLAVLAFMIGSDFIYIRTTTADNIFNFIIGAIFIYLGFGKPRHRKEVDDERYINNTRVEEIDRGDRVIKEERTERVDVKEPKDQVQKERVVHVDLSEPKSGTTDTTTIESPDRNK